MSDANRAKNGNRAILEQELLQQLRSAEEAYRTAMRNSTAPRVRYTNLSMDHPDGLKAPQQGAQIEMDALEKYRRALRRFSDLILRDVPPSD